MLVDLHQKGIDRRKLPFICFALVLFSKRFVSGWFTKVARVLFDQSRTQSTVKQTKANAIVLSTLKQLL